MNVLDNINRCCSLSPDHSYFPRTFKYTSTSIISKKHRESVFYSFFASVSELKATNVYASAEFGLAGDQRIGKLDSSLMRNLSSKLWFWNFFTVADLP